MKTWQKLKANPELWEKYAVREKVIDTIRAFFKQRGFKEMFTPILVPVPSAEQNLEVFESELRTARGEKRRGFLSMSPEYSLKKLISAGSGNVFEITKSFRNEEEVSEGHNPEFTMLEWYRVGADYRAVMDDFEEMFLQIIENTRPGIENTRPGVENIQSGENTSQFDYLGQKYDLTRPWPRISVAEAFLKYSGIDTETLLDEEKLGEAMDKKGYKRKEKTGWEEMFYQIFFNEIEPELKKSGRPVFVYDYPVSQAALSRKKVDDPRFAERFEVYLAGLELGNCFSELTDPIEQKARFESDIAARQVAGKTQYPIDEELIEALGAGMPDTAGIAVGVDRLVMLAANVPNISQTLVFPAGEMFGL